MLWLARKYSLVCCFFKHWLTLMSALISGAFPNTTHKRYSTPMLHTAPFLLHPCRKSVNSLKAGIFFVNVLCVAHVCIKTKPEKPAAIGQSWIIPYLHAVGLMFGWWCLGYLHCHLGWRDTRLFDGRSSDGFPLVVECESLPDLYKEEELREMWEKTNSNHFHCCKAAWLVCAHV